MSTVKDCPTASDNASFLGLLKKAEIKSMSVDVDKLSKDYAYNNECEECLIKEAQSCKIRDTCSQYNMALIDFKAGFNQALRLVIKKNN